MLKHDLGDGADLRLLELRHAPEFLSLVEANMAFFDETLGWASTMQNLEDIQKFIQRGIQRYTEDGLPWMGIWQDGVLAGGILFFPVDKRAQATEIGYWLGKEFTGRGLMSRAALVMLSFCFDALKLNRVALAAAVDNAASRAVADRLGFTLEGVMRQAWVRGARRKDLALYAMLAEDWRKLHLPLDW